MEKKDTQVVGNITLSLDGRVNGPGGPHDMGWIVPHATTPGAYEHLAGLMEATTVLLGRVNYDGFSQYWPGVAADEAADPRDRAFSAWLNRVDKVVFSTTLTASSWANTHVTPRSPSEVVRELRERASGDVVVLSSASVIRELITSNELDRLSVLLCPELVGAGERLFDGLPSSQWTLDQDPIPTTSGALRLSYVRS